MQIAMGLVDNVTTSTLQTESEFVPNFLDWLTDQIDQLKEAHLTFRPMLTTLDESLKQRVFLVG